MKNIPTRTRCNCCGAESLIKKDLCLNPIPLVQLASSTFTVTNKQYSSCVETVLCTDCGLIQPKYILESADILKLYENVKDTEYLRTAQMRGESNFRQVKNVLSKFRVDSPQVLEIGAGSGTTLNLLRKEGYGVEGIEPNKNFCTFANQEYGLELECMGYEQFKSDRKYDLILALDVIEHVVDPRRFMEFVRNLLSETGIAIIGTPDIDSVSAKLLGKRWYHIRPPHLFYFASRTFGRMLSENNLVLLEQRFFTWTFPVYYLVDALWHLIFGKGMRFANFLKFKLSVNLFDSRIYIIQRA